MRLHGASDCMRASRVQLAAQAAVHCPGHPRSDAFSDFRADAVKGGKLSNIVYANVMTTACVKCAYSLLLTLLWAVLAHPELMVARLFRAWIAMPYTSRLPTNTYYVRIMSRYVRVLVICSAYGSGRTCLGRTSVR